MQYVVIHVKVSVHVESDVSEMCVRTCASAPTNMHKVLIFLVQDFVSLC